MPNYILLGLFAISAWGQISSRGDGLGGAFSSPITAPSVNNVYYVDGYPASCTVAATLYTTQFDCAFATASAAAVAGSKIVTLRLGNGTYTTNVGAIEPDSNVAGVSIIGTGPSEGGGSNSVIAAGASLAAVVSHPDNVTGLLGELTLSGFEIEAANLANSCLDAYGLKVSTIEHIYCKHAIGTDHWMAIGNPAGCQGYGCSFQMYVNDLFVVGVVNGPSSYAGVTASQSGGVPSFVVNTAGTYRHNVLSAYLIGTGSAAKACSTMGTLTVTTAGSFPAYTVASVAGSGFAGCAGTMFLVVPDLEPANYGVRFSVTDSTLKDVVSTGVGKIAGIVSDHGGNTFIHAHAWQAATLFLDNATNIWLHPESDSAIVYGMDVESTGSTVEGMTSFWNGSYPGAREFYIGGSGFTVVGASCQGNQNAGGYLQFAAVSGQIFTGVQGANANAIPVNTSVFQAQECVTSGHTVNYNNAGFYGNGVFVSPYSDSASTAAMLLGSGANASNFFQVSNRSEFGYNSTTGNAVLQGTSGHGIDFNVNNNTFGSGNVAGVTLDGFVYHNFGADVASATTIAPSGPVFHVTGTTTIATITPSTACTTTGRSCEIRIIPAGIFSMTGGNLAITSTSVVGKMMILNYDPNTSKWYASY